MAIIIGNQAANFEHPTSCPNTQRQRSLTTRLVLDSFHPEMALFRFVLTSCVLLGFCAGLSRYGGATYSMALDSTGGMLTLKRHNVFLSD
jgi:hypothetical protein